jgi:hypothetical protein
MGFSTADPRNYLGMARQTASGTEASAGFKFLKYLGGSGFNVELESESVYEGGDGQDQGLHYRSQTRADGSFEAYARPDMFTFLSAWALGSAAAIGTSVGVGTSIFVPNATVAYLTIEQAWGGGNQIDRVSDGILTGIQVEGEAGQPWRVTVPFIGGATPYYRDGAASALTAVLESGDPAMYAGGAYLINGATQLDIRRWSYNFERQVDADLYTTETFRRKVVPLTRSVEVNFQLIWQSQSLYRDIVYGGGSVVPQTLATGAFQARRILTGSQMIGIDVPELRFTGVEVNRLDPDGETVVLDVSAMGVKGATSLVQHRITHASGVGASSYIPSGPAFA